MIRFFRNPDVCTKIGSVACGRSDRDWGRNKEDRNFIPHARIRSKQSFGGKMRQAFHPMKIVYGGRSCRSHPGMEIKEDMASRPWLGTKYEANHRPVSGVKEIKAGEGRCWFRGR
jgi:hypothetical protein